MIVAVAGLGTDNSQVAVPLVSGAVLPSTPTVWPTNSSAGGVLRGLLQRDQRGELVVGFELLLDLRELHELRGELVGVERIERVLVLELRGEQRQEGLEVAGDGVLVHPGRAGRAGRSWWTVVPEVTLGVVVAGMMLVAMMGP